MEPGLRIELRSDAYGATVLPLNYPGELIINEVFCFVNPTLLIFENFLPWHS